ncbi:MAG: hypothetical protein JO108_11930 [Acidobacteriaceae bacterium]|nr:hypothetical protein [Acidobacteriaceae bacterium]
MHKCLLILILAICPVTCAANFLSFTFDTDLQGWMGSDSGAPASPVWQEVGGNPGGYYSLSDTYFSEGTNSGVAQAWTHVDAGSLTLLSWLSLDVRVSNPINAAGYSLTAYLTGYDPATGAFAWSSGTLPTPTSGWQTISAPLNAFGCVANQGNCGSFSEINSLWIDLTFSGQDNSSPASVSLDLDNVTLTTNTPEPSLTAIVGAVLIAFGTLLSGKRPQQTEAN